MTGNQTEETRRKVKGNIRAAKIGEWIEHPFASMFLATAATATAVGFVLTGMALINAAIY